MIHKDDDMMMKAYSIIQKQTDDHLYIDDSLCFAALVFGLFGIKLDLSFIH